MGDAKAIDPAGLETAPAAALDPLRRLQPERGKTIHGDAANAGHRVLAPDDAEVEAYLETALKAPSPERSPDDRPGAGLPRDAEDAAGPDTVVILDFGSQFAQLIARPAKSSGRASGPTLCSVPIPSSGQSRRSMEATTRRRRL